MIIVTTTHKGGVGKTTTTATLGAGLAALGYNVLIIDTDSQGHAGLMLGLKKEIDGLYHWVDKKAPIEECLYRIDSSHIPMVDGVQAGQLQVLPSSDDTRRLQYDFSGIRVATVAKQIMAISKPFDVTLMDTPAATDPFRSSFDAALMFSADYFLIPTLCERLSVDGVTAMADLAEFQSLQQDAVSKQAQLLGIIPIRYRATNARDKNLTSLRNRHGDLVWDELRELDAWHKATLFDETVLTYDPQSEAAAEAWGMVRTLEGLCLKVPV